MAVPNLWRTKKQRYSLHGDVCVNCARIVFPPREICPHCHRSTQVHVVQASPIVSLAAMPAIQPMLQPSVAGDD